MGKWKMIPDAPEQTESRNYLMDLINRDIQFPILDIAGMTDTEQGAQGILDRIVNAASSKYMPFEELGLAEMTKTLEGGYDPRTSPYYEGLRDEANRLKSEGTSNIRRVGNIGFGGAKRASPITRGVGDYTSKVDTGLLQNLGRLYEGERNKMFAAGNIAQNVGRNAPLSILDQVATTGDLPRILEQLQNQAQYGSQVDTLTFPYTAQAPLAQSIINEPRYTYVQKDKKSKAGLGSAIGTLAGMALAAPTGGMSMATGGMLGGAVGGGFGSYF